MWTLLFKLFSALILVILNINGNYFGMGESEETREKTPVG
jgi:hypothetical protein